MGKPEVLLPLHTRRLSKAIRRYSLSLPLSLPVSSSRTFLSDIQYLALSPHAFREGACYSRKALFDPMLSTTQKHHFAPPFRLDAGRTVICRSYHGSYGDCCIKLLHPRAQVR